MELIENLETVKLSKFLKPLPQKLFSSLLDEAELTSSIHIIDSYGRSKNKYIEECIRNQQEISDSGLVVLFDTDYSWKEPSTIESSKFVVIRSIHSLADLMKSLQNILLGNWESMQGISIQFPLSLVVINNLSTFYWESKEKGILINEFKVLAKLFQKLQEKYGCSILTQSWDVSFDIGQGEALKTGKEPSLLPKNFLQYYKHVYYVIQNGNGDERVREIAYTQ